MTVINDADRRIRDYLAEGPTELPDRTYAVIRASVEQTLQRVAVGPVLAPRAGDAFRFSLAAVALVIVAVVGVNLVTLDGSGGPAGSALPSVSTAPTVREDPVGLPAEGTTPSDPGAGELVIHRSGSISQTGEMWVYEDGRLITWRFHVRPDDPSDAFIGLFVQRLTPEGVDFLRSAILGTGMFEADFVLARDGNAPFLEIGVRNGDRLVRGKWAWRGIAGDALTASPDEEAALLGLNALLTDPGSWPPTAWADPAPQAYVPSEYAICFGVRLRTGPGEWTGPFAQARVLAVLPQSAQDLLRAGGPTQDQSGMHADAGCIRVTTDAARSVARSLDEAGIAHSTYAAENWLAYELEDPRLPEHSIWIQFGPVLPNGEGVWLGPG